MTAQNGQYDLRFNLNDCDEDRIYVDIEIKASSPQTTFTLGDQNYRFSFTRNAVDNPFISEELEISGTVAVGNNIALYSSHDLNGSGDTIVSYNLELLSIAGYELLADEWVGIGRVGFDIIDPTACLTLTWHTPDLFPPVYVSEVVSDLDLQTAGMGTLPNFDICLSECGAPVPPVANDDNISVDAGNESVFNILSNDTTPTGASLTTVSLINNIPASQGTISVNNSGLTTFNPAIGFVGNVTPVTYEVCADNGLCDQAVIYITVEGQAPTANDDDISVNAGSESVFNVLANDDTPAGVGIATVTLVNNIPASQGTISVNNSGLTTFNPTIGFVGNVTPVTYEVCADNGLCDQAVIYITVEGQAPTANDDDISVNAGSESVFNVLANDNTPAGASIATVTLLNNIPASQGTISVNNSGLTTFNPTIGFVGSVTPITYEVCANNGLCDQAVIYITVEGQAPTANDDDISVNAGSESVFNVLANDNTPAGVGIATITLLNNIPTSQGTISVNDSGLTTFNPTIGFVGNVMPVTYKVCADNGLCDQAVINITVEGEAPTANDDNVAVLSAGGIFNILANDIIPTGQTVGTLTILTNPPASEGTITVNNSGSTNFIPAVGFSGNVTPLTYELCADNGLCDQAVIYIAVQAAPPTASDDNVTTNAGSSSVFNILTNDDAPAGSNFQTVELLNNIPASQGTLTTNNSGLTSFNPAAGFVGSVTPVTYEVCADNGLCDQADIFITVTGEFPIANDDNITIDAGNQSVFNILANDAAPMGANLETVSLLTNIPTSQGAISVNNSGLTTFTPAVGFSGDVSPINYEVCANNGLCDQAVIYIAVQAAPPTASDDNVTTNAGSSSVFNILTNDDAPAGSNFQTVELLNNIPASQGTLTTNNSGLTSFNPAAGFVGNVTPVTYEVCADNGLCDQADIFITVTGEFPIANDDNITVDAGDESVFNILANDAAPMGASLEAVSLLSNIPASQGTISVNNNGLTTFTPAVGFSGDVSPINYEVCADNGLCDQAIIFITVQALPPTANDDNVSINAGNSGSFNILANDDAPAGSNFQTVELLNNIPASQGTLTTNNSGLTSFTPAAGFVGNVTPVTYEVCTDNGLCDQAIIFITVTGQFPIANDDNITIDANTEGVFNILANDATPSGTTIETVTILTNIPASQGSITTNNNGLTTFTPKADFSGSVTPINYEICASNGLCNEAIIFITVLPPPTASVTGTLYKKDGTSPLTQVDIALSGDENDNMTTITGVYSFDVTAGGDYTITPTKTGNITNGVTAIDLAISQGHILGLFDLGSVYDVIAMDVNQSCTLTAIDLSITQAVILGLLDEFPEGKTWKFVPANIEFPDLDTPCDYEQFLSYGNLNTDEIGQDFIGMKIGDVNDSYDPTGGFTSNPPVLFSIANTLASPNEIIQIPVRISQAIDIATWQLTHTWDTDVLEFQGIETINQALEDGIAFGEQAVTEGQLTSLWLHPENLPTTLNEATIAYYLTFKVIGQTGTSTQISTNSDITPAIAYNADFEEIEIISTDGLLEIQAITDVTDISSENDILLFKNTPNPFSENTTIHFELPHAGKANILIYNILGKEIKRFGAHYEAGTQQLEWNDAAKYPAGMYTCELQFEHYRQTIKLLLTH